MESLFPDELLAEIGRCRVIAVLILDDVRAAVPVARALVKGGVTIMELTLRTPAALDCLKAVRDAVPEMTAGVGTILKAEQVQAVQDAGAAFGVSPGVNPAVILEANERGLPFAPGVLTPTDVDTAVELGCRELKFFPAEPGGGRRMFAAVKAPYAHLGLRYIPLGGINADNMAVWLSDPDIPAIGGSWLVTRGDLESCDWEAITRRAAAAREIVDSLT
ncbi:MAG: bifunctional 4-hydroxy-2-oxoglutarate aldolase/2-dehydro-3-deoxy-phosphogluconate aldolase [Planctomycetaceae bacterium]|nr:bifunctional 4-hydroxy-2-oxoglutarate aldolase/2-dehydro-3-deoxy-phosphogluconate aldolase [Planctomycetaceae bacterium]